VDGYRRARADDPDGSVAAGILVRSSERGMRVNVSIRRNVANLADANA
jgi:hypothetical protein